MNQEEGTGSQGSGRDITHGEDCLLWHPDCAIIRMERAVDYLRGSILVVRSGGPADGIREHVDRIIRGMDVEPQAPQAPRSTEGAEGENQPPTPAPSPEGQAP